MAGNKKESVFPNQIAPFQSHWPTLVGPQPLEQPLGIIERLFLLDFLLSFWIGGSSLEGKDHSGSHVDGRGCNWSIFAARNGGGGKGWNYCREGKSIIISIVAEKNPRNFTTNKTLFLFLFSRSRFQTLGFCLMVVTVVQFIWGYY
ncbi:hypothetical protein PIB30_067104 [Stylosanthes scabra]|uniref:Uncharacterized protein n=1 Tax=Stylosanthes scabra TaxID=79078 RepID=A0ABU6WM54_9FABA|nr:hypothetical protein [Stylosanthes scabra]